MTLMDHLNIVSLGLLQCYLNASSFMKETPVLSNLLVGVMIQQCPNMSDIKPSLNCLVYSRHNLSMPKQQSQ